MKIGLFDSGLGGLVVADAFIAALPEYDYLYLGDTKNLPYGEKSASQILEYTINAVRFLIKNDCKLIILACNTVSAVAIRHIQQKFIPEYNPDIKILGVVVPTVEEAIASSKKSIGVAATRATVDSKLYSIEIRKINPEIEVREFAAVGLVPAIENNDFQKADELVRKYVREFKNIDSLVLGCTHYPILKSYFKKYLPPDTRIISQDEFMGAKLKDYLSRHPEIDSALSKTGRREFLVTELNKHYQNVAEKIIPNIEIKETEI